MSSASSSSSAAAVRGLPALTWMELLEEELDGLRDAWEALEVDGDQPWHGEMLVHWHDRVNEVLERAFKEVHEVTFEGAEISRGEQDFSACTRSDLWDWDKFYREKAGEDWRAREALGHVRLEQRKRKRGDGEGEKA